MQTREFTHDELEDLEVDWRDSGGPVVACEVIDELRWSILKRIVFEHDGAWWQVDRQEGQDRWDFDPVTAIRVEPYTVSVTKYRPVT